VAAARAGAHTAFVGAVGDDDAARQLISVIDAESIDRSGLTTIADSPTGRALIGVSSTAENSIIVVPGANGYLVADSVGTNAALARVVLVQLEVPLAVVYAALQAARAAGAITILNPAPAPTAMLTAELLALCDVVIPNEHEEELLGGRQRLLELGAHAVIVTRGSRGAMVCTRDAPEVIVPAFVVNAIDTTAAGDAFCGSFAAAMARGETISRAVRFASAAGALATTRHGAVPSLPSLDEIEALLTRAG
jgi:ribokinase